MLINNKCTCSSWYNRVTVFSISSDRRKKLLYIDGSAYMAQQNTPLQSAWSTALSATCMTVGMSDLFIHLFIYLFIYLFSARTTVIVHTLI